MPSSPSQQVKDNARRMERYRNDPAFREKTRAKNRRSFRNTLSVSMAQRAKQRADTKGLEFDLVSNDISIPEVCPILGILLVVGTGGICDGSPTLDRINPKLGYVRGNVQVISFRANTLKSNATLEELKTIVAWMERN